MASFGYAVSNIGTKKLIPVQSTIAILFWMNVMQMFLAPIGTDPAFPLRLSGIQWLWAFGIAFGGTSAHYFLTNALRVADAIVVIPLDFLRIPLIAFVGWMFYGERLDLLVFAGAGDHRVGHRVEPARRDALNSFVRISPFPSSAPTV